MEIGDIPLALDGSFKCFLGQLIMILAIPLRVLSPERVSAFIVEKKQVLKFLLMKKRGIIYLLRTGLMKLLN